MTETTQYQYSIKFSIGTIVLLLLLMTLLLFNVLKTNSALGWILYGVFAVTFIPMLLLLILKRLVPALKGDIALAFDDEGVNDYIRDVSIDWKDIAAIDLIRGRSASLIRIDLKFESDYGSQIAIPLRWVKGNDNEIYNIIMAYFENDKLGESYTG